MGVYLRGNIYWCNFTVNGKRYQMSTKRTVEKEALEFEKSQIKRLSGNQAKKALLEKIKVGLVEQSLSFGGAWEYFIKYPRKKTPGKEQTERYYSIWGDFEAFCLERKITAVASVTDKDAVAYASYIREMGRYSKIVYERGGKKLAFLPKVNLFSASTYNAYIGCLKLIFTVLTNGKYVIENPFSGIQKMASDEIPREIFTESEIALLLQNPLHPLYGVVMIALYTGLRFGNMAHLTWDRVDLTNGWIRAKQEKTGNKVDIPILPPLMQYFRRLKQTSEFVLPDIAARYDKDESDLSKSFKSYLRELGIKNIVAKVEGRSKSASLKDIHSLRHTFAYIAGKHGVPLMVVQSVLGHMTPAMTRHYMAHATEQDKQQALASIPDLSAIGSESSGWPDVKKELLGIIESMNSENLEQKKFLLVQTLKRYKII